MKHFLNILLATFLFASCTKSTDKFTPYSSEFNDVTWSSSAMSDAKSQTIIAALSKPAYSANFNSSDASTLNVSNQVQLSMPSNSYSFNGASYNGIVNTNLIQLAAKGDFIRNLIPSCNYANLYDTKSVFLLNIKDNANNNLALANGTAYNISLVDSPITQNYIYLSGLPTTVAEGNVTWTVADSTNTGYLQSTSILMNGQTKSAYEIVSKKLNWISFATPINTGTLVNSSIILSAQNFTNKNTIVFAVFNDYNTVLRLQSDYTNKVFIAKNLPLGSSIKLVSISYIDGQFYLGKQDIVVSNSPQYTINPIFSTLTPSSINDVNSFLDGL